MKIFLATEFEMSIIKQNKRYFYMFVALINTVIMKINASVMITN